MNLLFYSAAGDAPAVWRSALATVLPQAQLHAWAADAELPACDYALVWKPPAAVFTRQNQLRAVFNLGAGVDAVLAMDTLPVGVPLIRLEDAGMALQMVEYVLHAVLRRYRRFDDYAAQAARGEWRPLPLGRRPTIGVLGLGALGLTVAAALGDLGFPVRGWSRTRKELEGGEAFAGAAELERFLSACDVLICLLPLTTETRGILNRRTLSALRRGALLINIARGDHLVEDDLLAALAEGQVGHAVLDVCRDEPLPAGHPLWTHPRVTLTPHIAALTLVEDSAAQIAEKIRRLEAGEAVSGLVDLKRGY